MKIFPCLMLLSGLTVSAFAVPADDNNSFAGIGVVLTVRGTNIVVARITPGSPAAARAELKQEDRLVAVAQGDQPFVEIKSLRQAVESIRGPLGTTVRLSTFHGGDDSTHTNVVSLVRAELKELSAWGNGKLLTNGTDAPNIEMFTVPGEKSEHLADHIGKIIVLDFWATWCGPCQVKMAELHSLISKHPEWKDKVLVIAASVDDDKTKIAPHLKARHWDQTHNVWIDTPARRAYGFNAIPTCYIIDAQGTIVAANPADIAKIVDDQLHQTAKSTGGLAFSGGDGSSMDNAIVITGAADESEGVHSEYVWLSKHYPRYKLKQQSLRSAKSRHYDQMDITDADGKAHSIFFDITAFFGK